MATKPLDKMNYPALQAEALKYGIRRNLASAKLRIALASAYANEPIPPAFLVVGTSSAAAPSAPPASSQPRPASQPTQNATCAPPKAAGSATAGRARSKTMDNNGENTALASRTASARPARPVAAADKGKGRAKEAAVVRGAPNHRLMSSQRAAGPPKPAASTSRVATVSASTLDGFESLLSAIRARATHIGSSLRVDDVTELARWVDQVISQGSLTSLAPSGPIPRSASATQTTPTKSTEPCKRAAEVQTSPGLACLGRRARAVGMGAAPDAGGLSIAVGVRDPEGREISLSTNTHAGAGGTDQHGGALGDSKIDAPLAQDAQGVSPEPLDITPDNLVAPPPSAHGGDLRPRYADDSDSLEVPASEYCDLSPVVEASFEGTPVFGTATPRDHFHRRAAGTVHQPNPARHRALTSTPAGSVPPPPVCTPGPSIRLTRPRPEGAERELDPRDAHRVKRARCSGADASGRGEYASLEAGEASQESRPSEIGSPSPQRRICALPTRSPAPAPPASISDARASTHEDQPASGPAGREPPALDPPSGHSVSADRGPPGPPPPSTPAAGAAPAAEIHPAPHHLGPPAGPAARSVLWFAPPLTPARPISASASASASATAPPPGPSPVAAESCYGTELEKHYGNAPGLRFADPPGLAYGFASGWSPAKAGSTLVFTGWCGEGNDL